MATATPSRATPTNRNPTAAVSTHPQYARPTTEINHIPGLSTRPIYGISLILSGKSVIAHHIMYATYGMETMNILSALICSSGEPSSKSSRNQ